MNVYVYIYVSHKDTVHLSRQGNRTMCGRQMDSEWTMGDETASGIAATCGTCKRAASKLGAIGMSK